MSKKLLVMAGGTGGHVFPAIAVAQTLQKEGWEILLVRHKRSNGSTNLYQNMVFQFVLFKFQGCVVKALKLYLVRLLLF